MTKGVIIINQRVLCEGCGADYTISTVARAERIDPLWCAFCGHHADHLEAVKGEAAEQSQSDP